jgi:hypothetical protein
MQSERALSEAVSVILIIVMILILSIVVAALVFGGTPFQQKSALIVSNAANPTVSGKEVFTLFHRAGDEFYLNKSLSGMHELGIYIDNSTNSSRAQPVLGLNVVKPGTTLYIYYNASKNMYRITTNSATLATNEAQTMTVCPRTIRLVDEQAKLLINKSSFFCVLTGPAPTVTNMNVTTGYRGWPINESIVGTNFLPGAAVKFNRSGSPDIPASSCTYVSSTVMNCTFDLLNRLASPANYNVVVTNPDGKQGMRANYFTLSSPLPTITSSTPATGAQASTVTITNLLGTNFQPGAVVDYTQGTTRINLTSVNVVSRTQITGTLVIPSGVPAGSYGVNITNTDNGKGYTAARFTVTSNAPTVTSITNATGYRGWPVIESIVGTNFVNGATVRFNRSGLVPDIPATTCTYVSSTRLNCTFDISAGTESPPTYNITVTNPDGKEGMRANVFTLSSAAPTITSSTPNTGMQTVTVPITNLVGTNFQPGSVVVYRQGATTIPLTGATVVSRTQITGTLVIPSAAPTGPYSVNITNPDGKTGSRAGMFTVTTNAPTLSSRTPTTGNRGWPVQFTINGGRFQSGATVTLTRGPLTIPVSNISVVSATQITSTPDLLGAYVAAGATGTSAWNVTVTNPDGKSVNVTNWFTVYSYQPTIGTPLVPSTGARGNTVSVTIPGTYFQPGAVVVLRNATRVISTGTSLTVVSPTQITCQFAIPSSGVTPGTNTYYVNVTNTDGRSRNGGNAFSIT